MQTAVVFIALMGIVTLGQELNDNCGAGQLCGFGMICKSGKCACTVFHKVDDGECVARSALPLGSSCQPGVDQCRNLGYCCPKEKKCICRPDRVNKGGACEPRPYVPLGGKCKLEQLTRCKAAAACVDGVCKCPPSAPVLVDGVCTAAAPAKLGQSCLLPKSKRSKRQLPIAVINGRPIGNFGMVPGVSTSWVSQPMSGRRIISSGSSWRMVPPVRKDRRMCVNGGVCGDDDKCVCPAGTRQNNDVCLPLPFADVGADCAPGQHCKNGAVCRDGKCGCGIGFEETSTSAGKACELLKAARIGEKCVRGQRCRGGAQCVVTVQLPPGGQLTDTSNASRREGECKCWGSLKNVNGRCQ